MSLALAAKHLAAQGRDGDSMLVHMSPKEVSSLQNVAMAHGGALSVNPHTGLPEAKFLESILPTLLGAGLAATGLVGAPLAAGVIAAAQYARTGDISKGLMAGLGAYGGAGIAEGLTKAGASAAAKAAVPSAPLPGLGGGPIPPAAASAGLPASVVSPSQFVQSLPTTMTAAPMTPMQQMGAGLGQATSSAKALGSFVGENKAPLMASGLSIAAGQGAFDAPKPPKEEAYLRPYQFSPGYTGGVGDYPKGYTGERQYFRPTLTALPIQRLAEGGATDVHLERGGFVVPADVVSALGNGSSSAGLELLAERLNARPIKGPGDGMSDSIRTSIEGKQKAAVARDEAYVPQETVKHVGGAKRLYDMMDKVRNKAHGKPHQQRKLANPSKLVP